MNDRTHRSRNLLIVLCAASTAAYLAMLLLQPTRDGLILWPRAFDASFDALAPLALVALLYAAASGFLVRSWTDETTRRQRWTFLALVAVGGLALQWAMVRVTHVDVFEEILRRTYAWKTGGYWTVGAGVTDVADFIGGYVERAPGYPVHQMRHPPGLSLIFWLGTRLFELLPGPASVLAAWAAPESCQSLVSVDAPAAQMASGVFGALVEIAAASAAIVPLYALVRRTTGERAAVFAALAYSLTPGFSLWVSQFDRGIAIFTPAVLLLCENFVRTRSLKWMAAAGVLLSFATFLTFGAAPIGLIAAIYTIARALQNRPFAFGATATALVRGGVAAVVGVASLWVVAYATTGLNVVALYEVVFDSHLGIEFPFWPFVFWHPWDIVTMIGLAVVAAAFAGLRRVGAKDGEPTFAFAASFALALAILSVVHVARGETGRVWLYFAPIAVAAAAAALRARVRAMIAALALLGLQTFVMGAVLRVHEYGYMPDTLPEETVPSTATTVDTRFGASGQIALLAYEIESFAPGFVSGKEAAIRLYWQRMSDEPIWASLRSFVHVANDESDQVRIAQADGLPMREAYPTTCWAEGQVVVDEQRFRVSDDAAPGEHLLFVGLYDPLDGRRPPTFASLPAQQMHGSVLLPTRAVVRRSR